MTSNFGGSPPIQFCRAADARPGHAAVARDGARAPGRPRPARHPGAPRGGGLYLGSDEACSLRADGVADFCAADGADTINTAAIAMAGIDLTTKPSILCSFTSETALQPVTDQQKGRPVRGMGVARIGG